MIIKALIPINKGKSKICLSNGTDFVLYKGDIKRYNIKEGYEITEEIYGLIFDTILIPRCRKRAMHLLEKQDRTKENIRQKLKEGGYPDIVIDDAIEYLSSYHYLDDERYANNYIRFHQDKKSKKRIAVDRMVKGVSKDIIDRALEESFINDEKEQILQLIEKKQYDKNFATQQERAKMYRFLAYRGFSGEDILKHI